MATLPPIGESPEAIVPSHSSPASSSGSASMSYQPQMSGHLPSSGKMDIDHVTIILDAKAKEIVKVVDSVAIQQLLPEKTDTNEGLRVINTLNNLQRYINKVDIAEDGTYKLKVRISGTKRHFYIYHDGKDQDNIRIVFDRFIKSGIESGCQKKLRMALELSVSAQPKKLFFSKMYSAQSKELKQIVSPSFDSLKSGLSPQQIKKGNDYLSIRNEMRVAQAKIPGTAKVHFVSLYEGVSKVNPKKPAQILKLAKMDEFYTGGTLIDRLDDPTITLNERVNIIYKLAQTIEELHKRGFSHNDLKPENILLDDYLNPVLADFGGTTLGPNDEGRTCGTPIYLPPEMINRDTVDQFRQVNQQIHTIDEENYKVSEERMRVLDMREKLNDYNPVSEQDQDKKNEYLESLNDNLEAIEANLKDLMHSYEELNLKNEELVQQAQQSINPSGWIPQKNDNFALGLIIKELIPDRDTHPLFDEIVAGLLEVDPTKRWTAGQVVQRLNDIIPTE